jgi:intracellular septation protein A
MSPETPTTEAANGEASSTAANSRPKPKQNTSKVFVELIVCIIIPTLILKKLSGDDMAGPMGAFLLAISLPLGMALYEFYRERKVGLVAAIGFISILLTGSIGLFKLPKEYIAYKEALIPGVFALLAFISTRTKRPLIRLFLYNDMIMDTEKVAHELATRDNTDQFEQVMRNATLILAGSFILSSILNFVLAKIIIVSETGSAEFNSELGTMNLLSYPVIMLPCMVVTIYALFYVVRNIKRLTGLTMEDIVHQ